MKLLRVLMTVAMLTVLLVGCSEPETTQYDSITAATLQEKRDSLEEEQGETELEVREITEYQGMNLDPANSLRENSIKGVQNVDITDYELSITGLVDNPLALTYDEVLAFDAHERLIRLYCVEGWDVDILWKGIKITDLLEAADTKGEANTVIFKAVDGYSTSMPLQTVIDRDMLLAYAANDITLPAKLGFPFIVVAEDQFGYKWARWVDEIELSSDASYEGYWEKRGYPNNAEVPDFWKEEQAQQ